MQRLKLATNALHQRVERSVDLKTATLSVESFIALHYRFASFYEPLEHRLSALPWHQVGLDFPRRMKLPKIIAAIESLRQQCSVPQPALRNHGLEATVESSSEPTCKLNLYSTPPRLRIPEVGIIPEGLGCLYVLEGATLGGKFICKYASAQQGIDPSSGGQFFNSYGGDVGPMWQGFGDIVNSYVAANPTAENRIIAAAEETFACFEEWFSCRSECS